MHGVTPSFTSFASPEANRATSTIDNYLDYFKSYIIPEWGDVALEDVDAVAVEKWLRTLDLAPGSKAKIRNHMSLVFSHCIRHRLYVPEFQGMKWQECLQSPVDGEDQPGTTAGDGHARPEKIGEIISRIGPPAVRVMVMVARASALRRSAIRGRRWKNLNFDDLWIDLKQGVYRMDETKLKTRASRKGVPMLPEPAEVL